VPLRSWFNLNSTLKPSKLSVFTIRRKVICRLSRGWESPDFQKEPISRDPQRSWRSYRSHHSFLWRKDVTSLNTNFHKYRFLQVDIVKKIVQGWCSMFFLAQVTKCVCPAPLYNPIYHWLCNGICTEIEYWKPWTTFNQNYANTFKMQFFTLQLRSEFWARRDAAPCLC
jgi:hypothetical protein